MEDQEISIAPVIQQPKGKKWDPVAKSSGSTGTFANTNACYNRCSYTI